MVENHRSPETEKHYNDLDKLVDNCYQTLLALMAPKQPTAPSNTATTTISKKEGTKKLVHEALEKTREVVAWRESFGDFYAFSTTFNDQMVSCLSLLASVVTQSSADSQIKISLVGQLRDVMGLYHQWQSETYFAAATSTLMEEMEGQKRKEVASNQYEVVWDLFAALMLAFLPFAKSLLL